MTDNREALIEAMARGMAEAHIRIVRRWDASPTKIEETMPRAVDACWKDFAEAATAALSAIEAMGCAVVPVKATDEMSEAALNADLDIYWTYLGDGRPDDPRDVYTAMISASPFAKEKTDDK